MKKKLLAFTIIGTMIASVAGCGSETSNEATGQTEIPAQETALGAQPDSTETKNSETTASEPEIVLTWNEVNGEGYGAVEGAKVFKETLEEVSGGTMTIELYLNGTLGNEQESMQGIQMGTLDIFRGNASSLPNYGAETIGVTGLPFLFSDMDDFETMAVSQTGEDLLNSVDEADCGYIALDWLVEGPRQLFITQATYEKLGSPSEFTIDMMKGLKIRVPETDLMVNTMSALGASATPIAYAELYTSLQSGVVDGAENGVTSYASNSFNEVAPYFITDAHTFGCGVILMNKDKWNSLTEQQQEWMRQAGDAASLACYEFNKKQEQEVFDSFESLGVTKLEVPDLEKWQEACSSVYSGYDPELVQKLASSNY